MTTHGHGQKHLTFVGLWAGKERKYLVSGGAEEHKRRIFGEGKLLYETEGCMEGRESKAQKRSSET